MKSVSELLELIQRALSGDRTSRRRQKNNRHQQTNPEALEPRLLLTADLSDALFNELSLTVIEADQPVQDFFVAFEDAQSLTRLQSETGADRVEESKFVENGYMLTFGDGITMQEGLDRFGDMDGFEYFHPDVPQQLVPFAIPNDPLFGDQWHHLNTGQGGGQTGIDSNIQNVWDNYTGEGVTIAIVDDGFEHSHEDLAANARTDIDFDWNGNDNDPSPVAATDNHGTAVGGVAGSVGNNGIGGTGSSWNADLVGLRLIAGPISDQDIAEALTHESQIIDIYNNSWGRGGNGRTFPEGPQTMAALANSVSQGRGGLGTIQVFSAGNGGAQGDDVGYRALQGSRHTIAIGALGNNGTLAPYSTVGAAVIVVAPSNGGSLGITTTDRTGSVGYSATNYADDFGGTSSAAPLVSGVIGLMLEANPNLTYRDVTNILARTAEQVDPNHADWVQNGAGLWVNHDYGFGNIDAEAAVDYALNEPLLGEEQSFFAPRVVVNQDIPDNGAAVTSSYTVSAGNSIGELEYVELVMNANHGFIGDLEVILTSPSGTESVLAKVRASDPATTYSDWVFTTARNWGESSEGTWTVSVRDGAAQDTGRFNSFQLRFYGAEPLGPVVTESNGSTIVEEFGLTDSFDVSLGVQPTSNVVMNLSVQDPGEVSIDKTQLIFTPTNWQTPQTVTVSGVLDFVRDGDQISNIIVSVNDALSDDQYDNYDDIVVDVTTIDNDFNIPAKPNLIAPSQTPGISTPRFAWEAARNAVSYDLIVRNLRTNTITQQVSDVTSLDHTFLFPFSDGVYEAVLTARGATGIQGPSSDPLRFAIGEVLLPGVPTVITPSVGQVLTTSFPTFEWTTASEAFSYEIYVRTGDNILMQEVTPVVGATTVQYQFGEPLKEGDATVWVRGLNALGQPGEWTTPTPFVIDAVPAPGRPTIIRPNVAVTDNAFPTFVWAAPGGNTYQLWVGQTPDDPANGTASSLNNRVIHLRDHSSTDYTHFKPLENGNYTAWVRSFNTAGEPSPWSNGVNFEVDVPIPARPQITQVIENGSRPTIQWGTTGEDFPPNSTFHLWVNNLTTGQSQVIQERELTSTSYTPDFDLAQGRYAAWVQVMTPIGIRSSWSARYDFEVDIETPANTSMTGPAGSDGGSITNDKPTFEWNASAGAATYELWVNNVTLGLTRIVHEKAVEGTSFTPENSLPQGTYKAWVRGINAAGEVGDWTRPLTFHLDIPGPATPTVTGPQANQVGTVTTSTPEITWETLGGADTWNLELQTASNQQTVSTQTGLTEQSWTPDFQLNQTTYRVRVQAVNSAGEQSAFSEWYSFRIDVANPTTPTALTPNSTVTSNSVTFTWSQEDGNVRHEILVRDLLRQETIVFQVGTGAGAANDIVSYTDQLRNGTYRFWVRGFNSQGVASGWSNSKSFIVDGTDLAALDQNGSSVLSSLKADAVVPTPEMDQELVMESEAVVAIRSAESIEAKKQEERTLPVDSAPVSTEDLALETFMAELADPASGLKIHDDSFES